MRFELVQEHGWFLRVVRLPKLDSTGSSANCEDAPCVGRRVRTVRMHDARGSGVHDATVNINLANWAGFNTRDISHVLFKISVSVRFLFFGC